mgnify:CR=1 FL=1
MSVRMDPPRTRVLPKAHGGRFSFGAGEWSGAFGDIGTDLPLLAGILMASGMPPVRVFIVFGLLQIASGWVYRMPMAVQPLKAVAALVIAQGADAGIITGAGFAIGAVMLALALSRGLQDLSRLIPEPVIRGIQFGLGLKLFILALGQYVGSQGWIGYLLALAAAAFIVTLPKSSRCPVGLLLLLFGVAVAWMGGAAFPSKWVLAQTPDAWGLPLPQDIWAGFLLLAVPQLPLSLGNSILATQRLADDWFPERGVTIRKIGLGYGVFNVVAALLGGIPVCHGSGGMAGHYTFGGRTGGSVIIYGAFFISLGLAVHLGALDILAFFPLPILGVMLAREAWALMGRIRQTEPGYRWIAALVGILAASNLPNGFLIAMAAGSALYYISITTRSRRSTGKIPSTG